MKVVVIGAGSWGTALGVHLARVGHDVALYARDAALVDRMRTQRENDAYLPGVRFPEALQPIGDAATAIAGSALLLWAVPSHGTRDMARLVAPHVAGGTVVVSATKGLERGTWTRMSRVLSEEMPVGCPVVVLSGPSFAHEVARELPTAVVAATSDAGASASVLAAFRGKRFRLYATDDVVGVELGGAYKNVIAIAAGVVEGLGLGHNALAGLVTRGLAEMTRLALALGGRQETLAGLSGLGDLVLTCTGAASRNHHLGEQLGQGRPLAEILASTRMVAEGVNTAEAVLALGLAAGVELPIAVQMADVLAGRTHPLAATEALMLRPQKHERL
ncbi:MAG TPA: NAD(P)H-dependent glycerol-3-phosphate dehydrogenase [Luteitalea sp.]|nr:NAD(P)H-dependent glycerol-3-phosphate dehydrogenase [Luteitalea sp.]